MRFIGQLTAVSDNDPCAHARPWGVHTRTLLGGVTVSSQYAARSVRTSFAGIVPASALVAVSPHNEFVHIPICLGGNQ